MGVGSSQLLGDDSSCLFSSKHPLRYAADHLNGETIEIDGKLDEKAWQEAQWTTSFMDIQGPTYWSQPWYKTQVKIRYDDKFLYVGAYLEERNVWAKQKNRNDIIFYDNDFEIFVDPVGTTHNYKEFEVNALNSTWNLFLNKPYRDGGGENSTRVDPINGFDMYGKGLKSAIYVKGTINDPRQHLHYWTAEVALPLKELAWNTTASLPPKDESFWRINFSRVEWLVQVLNGMYEKIPNLQEENWVWSPQGAIAMHMPEKWGYLQFRKKSNSKPVPEDPEFPARHLAFQVYYAEKEYYGKHKRYTSSLDTLIPFIPDESVQRCLQVSYLKVHADGFYAGITRNGYTAHIRITADPSMSNAEKPKFVSSLALSIDKDERKSSSSTNSRKVPSRKHSNDESSSQHTASRHHDDGHHRKSKKNPNMMYVPKKDIEAGASSAPSKFESSLIASTKQHTEPPPLKTPFQSSLRASAESQPSQTVKSTTSKPFVSSLQASVGKISHDEKPVEEKTNMKPLVAEPASNQQPPKTLKQTIVEKGLAANHTSEKTHRSPFKGSLSGHLDDRRGSSSAHDERRFSRRQDDTAHRQVYDNSKGNFSRQSSRESSYEGDRGGRRFTDTRESGFSSGSEHGSKANDHRKGSIHTRLGPPVDEMRKVHIDDAHTPARLVRRVSNTSSDGYENDRRTSFRSAGKTPSFEKPPVHGSSLLSSIERNNDSVPAFEKPAVKGSSLLQSISTMKTSLTRNLACNSPAHARRNENKIKYTLEELRRLNTGDFPRPADLRDMTVIVELLSPRTLASKKNRFSSSNTVKPLKRSTSSSQTKGTRNNSSGGRNTNKYNRHARQAAPIVEEGPVQPYEKTEGRWVPSKEKVKPKEIQNQVKTLLNKLTRDRFEKLTLEFCAIPIPSLDALSTLIAMIMDKALEEPSFSEVYADLCQRLHQHYLSQPNFSFLRAVYHLQKKTWYWTAVNQSAFTGFHGPFPRFDACLDVVAKSANTSQDGNVSPDRVHDPKFFMVDDTLAVIASKIGSSNEFYYSAMQTTTLSETEPLLGAYSSEELAIKAAAKLTSFKRLLVTRCQDKFDTSDHKVKPADDEAIRAARRTKTLMLGNMRFLGELFKVELIAESVIQMCIFKLLGLELIEVHGNQAAQAIRMPDEEDLEALCKMLSTVGKKFDHKGNKTIMTMILVRLVELSDTQQLASRIRFLLKDILEMRDHQWVPRRKELQQKTLQEVRKEAEKLQKLGKNAQHDDLQGKRHKAAHSSLDVAKKNSTLLLHQPVAPVDPTNRIKSILNEFLSLHDMEETRQCVAELAREAHIAFVEQTLTLALEGKESVRGDAVDVLVGLYETFHLGATEIQTALLGTLEFLDDLRIDIPMVHEYCGHILGRLVASGCFGLNWLQPAVNHLADCGLAGVLLAEILSVLEAEMGLDKTAAMIQREELQVQVFLPHDQQSPDCIAAYMKKHDLESFFEEHGDDHEDELYEEAKTFLQPIVEEYMTIEDLQEVDQCLGELAQPWAAHMIKLCLNILCGCKSDQRNKVIRLLEHLINNGKISQQEYEMGLESFLELYEDIQIDVPQAASYIAPVVALGLSRRHISWNWLAQVVEGPSRAVGQLVEATCSNMESTIGHEMTVSIAHECSTSVDKFVSTETEKERLKKWFM